MIYLKAILYQCLFFIIFLSKWSSTNGNNDTTTITNSELTSDLGNNDTTTVSNSVLITNHGRIVNGTKVKLGKFPYIVSLRRSNSMNLFCGGSLIRDKWVLTAGHCMFLNEKLIPAPSVMVVGGELQLNPSSFKRQTSLVKKIIVHPTYSHDYLQDDIALLLLESPFKLDTHLKLTRWSSTMPRPGTKCVTAGWGYEDEMIAIVSNDLMSVELPILPQRYCKILLADIITITPNMFCAGFTEGGKDACQGDSGGPFECDGVLTGIVSGGLGCARPNRPGFYTKVKYYTTWINFVLQTNGTCKINVNYCSIISFVTLLYIFSSSIFI